jgi:alpha-tubulin suppressor-like RCC1 family protein
VTNTALVIAYGAEPNAATATADADAGIRYVTRTPTATATWTPTPTATNTATVTSTPTAQTTSVFSAGKDYVCAMNADSSLSCWGRGDMGQLGNWINENSTTASFVRDGSDLTLTGIVDIDMGGYHGCALGDSGGVWCWGGGEFGQLGTNDTNSYAYATRVLAPNSGYLTGIVDISAGEYHTCAVTDNGQAWCWGNGLSGALGNQTTESSMLPTQVYMTGDIPLTNVQRISSGASHTCAVTSNGQVWCWGTVTAGSLGDGVSLSSTVAVPVYTGIDTPLTNISQVSAGTNYSCAVDTNGAAWCWGDDGNAVLANGANESQSWAARVTTQNDVLTGAIAVAAADTHACLVTTSGDVWCWGAGATGQLGNGSETAREYAVPVALDSMTTLTGMAHVTVGLEFSCARATGQSAYCWGSNNYGQLGDDSVTSRLWAVPVTVWP